MIIKIFSLKLYQLQIQMHTEQTKINYNGYSGDIYIAYIFLQYNTLKLRIIQIQGIKIHK